MQALLIASKAGALPKIKKERKEKMKHFIAALLSTVLITTTTVGAFNLPGITEEDENVTFIVEVEGNPSLVENELRRSSNLESITDEILEDQAKVMSAINDEISDEAEQGFVYTALFNGFSIEGKKSMMDDLKSIDGVKNVYISQRIEVSKPLLNNAGELSYVDKAYNLKYSGKGQVIAVIDDACDTSHDFFKAAPESPKYSMEDIDSLVKTRELNSKATAANQVYKNAKIPYAFNYVTGTSDTYSSTSYHGTHVTGIAAGKDGTLPDGKTFSGVAYDSQVLFMSVGKDGIIDEDKVFAAINDASLLEADVINMSFGSTYSDSATAEAYTQMAENARKSGISLIASAGNSARGYNEATPLAENIDYSSMGSPACIQYVTAVASAENTKGMVSCWGVKLSNETQLNFFRAYTGSEFVNLINGKKAEYVDCGYGRTEEFENADVDGKIALIKRGEITFAKMAENAASAGAVGIIIINTNDTVINIAEIPLPAAIVKKTTGDTLLADTDKKITYVGGKIDNAEIENGGKISTYSGWGVDSSLELKPELTAPGGNIYSAYPDNKYVYLSGTSMSSPYYAGISAIEREYYETAPYAEKYNTLSGEELTDLLENIAMNSAEIIRYSDGTAYSPRVQGAGLVNAENIINSKVLITGNSGKAKVSLKEIKNNFEVKFKITNISKNDITFDNVSMELMTDGYAEENGKNYVGDTVKITAKNIEMPESITVASGEDYDFTANVELSSGFLEDNSKIFKNGFFVDGFVVLDTVDDSNYASVPFTGFYGDFGDAPVFDSTTYDEGGSALADKDNPYTSGTMLKAYANSSTYYFVGRNMYDTDIADKKYISFSNTAGLQLAFSWKAYRATSNISFLIEDANKNEVYSDSVNMLFNKFRTLTYRFDGNVLKNAQEGNYTLRVSAVANGSRETTDSMELPIVIDNTAPKIISAKYNSETKKVSVSASDNHYIAFISASLGGTTVYRAITDDDITDNTVTADIDLSKFSDPENVTICVCDYAMNATERSLPALTDKIGVDVNAMQSIEGVTLANLTVRNNSGADITTDILLAFYDEDTKLITVVAKEDYKLNVGDNNISYRLLEDTRAAKSFNVFVWDLDSLKPVDSVKKFDLSKK